ncbi:hypothetical protein A4A49_64329 [Nicotiana attenuata]|uniref:Uncharacterized protein n=1 Tax=Nicotiana attenuata TaxID=49451 RepID=A0A1J6IHN0_NICAT|nr:hypothetical protein A4A49_64329 [Nicotiana attenuata]
MAGGRGRPKKQALVIVGSSVSARVIAETLENGSEQRVITPLATQFPPLSPLISTSKLSTGARKLNISEPLQLQLPGITEEQQSAQLKQPDLRKPEQSLKGQETNITWSGLFNRNRAATNDMSLDYIPPELIDGNLTVKLDKEETNREAGK